MKIIDEDEESARFLADTLKDAVVIHGEMMSDVILTEAGIQSADAAIAVTSHDKDNLLASLLAKKAACLRPFRWSIREPMTTLSTMLPTIFLSTARQLRFQAYFRNFARPN